jgi:uncharacterized protein YcfL
MMKNCAVIVNAQKMSTVKNAVRVMAAIIYLFALLQLKILMSKRNVVNHAKQIVLDYGPAVALENTAEVVQQSASDTSTEAINTLITEVRHQAKRTYRFLGYDPPTKW